MLLERELFGYARGAFPAALRDRSGQLEVADGGTLLLDEVGALPPDLQARILRVIEDGTLRARRRGRRAPRSMRASSPRPTAICAARSRRGASARISTTASPSSRSRCRRCVIGATRSVRSRPASSPPPRGDWAEPALRLSVDDVAALEAAEWPGNVRELLGVIERAAVRARGASLDLDAVLAPSGARQARFEIETEAARRSRERANIEAALAVADGKIYGPDGAAKILGIKPTTLASRIKALGIGRTA